MKRLLYITFIISSFSGFSQEKKGVCAAGINLYHYSGNDSISDDHFNLNGFYLTNPLYYGSFINSTTWSDSVTYEITLPFGDSLLYSAYWHADGPCNSLDSADVNSLVTFLDGTPFLITHKGDYFSYFSYHISQEGIIKNPCFFKIQRLDIPDRLYFIRVNFLDPPQPEAPLDLPEITNDLSLWLSSENTLTVKADEDAVWEMNLYSLSGQVIQKSTLQGSQEVDVSNLPKGCYIARISNGIGAEKQLKFVK